MPFLEWLNTCLKKNLAHLFYSRAEMPLIPQPLKDINRQHSENLYTSLEPKFFGLDIAAVFWISEKSLETRS